MKFYSVPEGNVLTDNLDGEYKAAREIGVIRIGKENLFFRVRLKHFAIPYKNITRMFRRVREVPAQVCCGKGSIGIESLVVCTDEGEAAEIQLPGTRAARALMEDLKALLPNMDFSAPSRPAEESKTATETPAEA